MSATSPIRRSPALMLRLLLLPLALCAPLVAAAAAPAIPKLEGRVNDYAHVLSPQQKAQLESQLKDEEDRTSNQIVILTVPSLEGDTIEDYAVKVFKAWKLGQKGRDNGALVVAAIQDRKMRIEVGYGLEGTLTDAISSQIIRDEMAPRFKAGDFGGGLLAATNAIEKAIRGEYKAIPRKKQQSQIDPGTVIFWMIFLFIILISHVRFHRYPNHWLGPYWISGNTGGSFGSFSSGGFSGGGGGFSGGGGGSGGGGASGGW